MSKTSVKPNRLRSAFKILLIILTIIAGTMFSIVQWTEHQFLNTDNWVAAVGPLPKEPVISSAMGLYVSNQLFDSVDVQQKIEEALPPKAAFLAAPLSEQLKSLVQKITTKTVASDAFQTVWIAANKKALNSQLQAARGEKKPALQHANEKINININSIKSLIATKLGNVADSIPSLSSSNTKTLSIQADLQTTPRIVQRTVKQIDFIHAVLPFFALATFLGALALSNDRVKTTLRVSLIMLAIYLVKIIGAKTAKDQLLGQINDSAYVPAVARVYDVLTGSLFHILYLGLIVFAGVSLLCLLLGPSKIAVRIRQAIRIASLRQSSAYKAFVSGRNLVKKYMWPISISIGFFGLIYLAFGANLNLVVISKTVLTVTAIATLLYIYATPKKI